MATTRKATKKTQNKRQPKQKGLPLKRAETSKRAKNVKTSTMKTNTKKLTKKPNKVAKQKSNKRIKHLNLKLGSWQLQIIVKPIAKTKRPKKVLRPLAIYRQVLGIALIVLGLAGAVYFGLDLFKPAPTPPAVQAQSVPVVQADTSERTLATYLSAKPTRARIPAIGIDTDLTTVGQMSDGSLEVPKLFDVAAWYREGPTPGELGPAIIVGHVDSYRGPAVFWRLSQLVPGQSIEIDREDGTTVKFKVDSVKQFDQDAFPTKEVYGDIDHAGLRLITCGGRFDRLAQRYTHNTVVFATLVQ